MSRPLRIEYPGAWYHIMHRGASRADIFDTDADRQTFLALLSDIHRRFAIQTHSYCLMENHYHLLLHTPEGRLARGMRHVNGLYTQYLNQKRGADGALFRGRYKSLGTGENRGQTTFRRDSSIRSGRAMGKVYASLACLVG